MVPTKMAPKKGVDESAGLREPLVSSSNIRESKRIKTEDI